MHDWLLCKLGLAPGQSQVSNLSRKGWVCSLRTHRSTGEKVMFCTAVQGPWAHSSRGGASAGSPSGQVCVDGPRETLGNGLKTQINIWTRSCVNRRKRRKGQETGLSRDIGASRLPRAGRETGQDPLGTEARAEGVDGGGRRPGSSEDWEPLCSSHHLPSVAHPSLIDGNRLMTGLWSKWSL